MAKLNTGELKQQVERLLDQLELLNKTVNFKSDLRRIENLTEKNFQLFLAQRMNNLKIIEGSFYFPVGSGLTTSSIGDGKFARQA